MSQEPGRKARDEEPQKCRFDGVRASAMEGMVVMMIDKGLKFLVT